MNKSQPIIDIGAEQVLWQGRPTPRCYTLRHGRSALRWAAVWGLALIWQIWMWHAWNADAAWGVVFLPVPLLLVALALSLGRLVRARLQWEHVFYLMSHTGLWIQRGRNSRVTLYSYTALEDVRLELYRNSIAGLGWVHAQFGTQNVTLECLEDAQKAYTILEKQLQRYGQQQDGKCAKEKAEQRCENKR
ncbi:MAG: hypothetical protein ABR516_05200 [Desulfuromonadaceae bacterium]